MSKLIFIAEAGVNHNGDLSLAKRLIDVAAEAGADYVKFQSFKTSQLVTADAPKAAYQKRTTSEAQNQYEMLRSLELSERAHDELFAYCGQCQIGFLSSPFDVDSLHFLTNKLGLKTLKIASGEITNGPLLLEAARSGCHLIVSTGMSTLEEVRQALQVLAFGYLSVNSEPSKHNPLPEDFSILKGRVSLLHCTSQYPAPVGAVNLKAIHTLARAFDLEVGYSDHTLGYHVSLAAIAMGARIIEKHFTLSRRLPGPDHPASLEPEELKELIKKGREIELALGSGEKLPAETEQDVRRVARKSLVAKQKIRTGETFTAINMAILRPGTGRSPMEYWDWLGKIAHRDFSAGETIG